jgi:hypothetical protein
MVDLVTVILAPLAKGLRLKVVIYSIADHSVKGPDGAEGPFGKKARGAVVGAAQPR